MLFRISDKGNQYSSQNLMKCSFISLVLSYLLCNLWLQAVMAVPEVAPIDSNLKPKLHSYPDGSVGLSLEKRSAPTALQYNLGTGVREGDSEDMDDISEDIAVKRGEPQNRFSFGLGKRGKLGEQRFSFGLGKRGPNDNRFQFGLGKRGPNDNRFQFGLGKRANNQRDNRFSFGLGKRVNDFEEYIKRRYSFGLGKRNENQNYLSER